MPRHRTNLQPIEDEFKRRTVFKQRKAGLFKKASELSILCGIDLCAIVYDGSSDSNPDVFSSVSDVSSLLSRFSSMSEKDKHKGTTKQHSILQKQIAAKQAELQKIELKNRELLRSALNMVDTQLGMVGERIRELRYSELTVGHDGLFPVPCTSTLAADSECISLQDWMVPTSRPVPVTSIGYLGPMMQLQDWLFSDLMVPSVSVSQERQLSDMVGSLSDLIGSTVVNSIGSGETVQEGSFEVDFGRSDESDRYSVELNPKKYIDIDELFDSIDIESIGSVDLESIGLLDLDCFLSFDFESLGSEDPQETNVSNSVWSAETSVGSDGSHTYSLELNPRECVDIDELLDLIDIDSIGSLDTESIGSFDLKSIGSVDIESILSLDTESIGSFDLESIGSIVDNDSFLSFDFESIGSDDRQETNLSNSAGSAETSIASNGSGTYSLELNPQECIDIDELFDSDTYSLEHNPQETSIVSDGSDTYSLELNPQECIDIDELFDSIDIDSIESLVTGSIGSLDTGLIDLESFLSFDFESIGSDGWQEMNGSNSVGSTEASIALSALEKDLLEMESLYYPSELPEAWSSCTGLESSSCDDWREYLSVSDFELC